MIIMTTIFILFILLISFIFYKLFTKDPEIGVPTVGTFVEKPWGQEEIWANHHPYVGKILHINNGCKLSLQYHKNKDETIRVLNGILTLIVMNREDGKVFELQEGEIFHIIPRLVHRMEARSGNVSVLETSTSELWDVVRLEDDYNRVQK